MVDELACKMVDWTVVGLDVLLVALLVFLTVPSRVEKMETATAGMLVD